mmetsp:Transcript_42163/g.111128  ORF Transcript_42163/g.111128 Transcript_42163/m.111128 type:complete len:200 (-) Transcript_42163:324-923(-)
MDQASRSKWPRGQRPGCATPHAALCMAPRSTEAQPSTGQQIQAAAPALPPALATVLAATERKCAHIRHLAGSNFSLAALFGLLANGEYRHHIHLTLEHKHERPARSSARRTLLRPQQAGRVPRIQRVRQCVVEAVAEFQCDSDAPERRVVHEWVIDVRHQTHTVGQHKVRRVQRQSVRQLALHAPRCCGVRHADDSNIR